MKRGLVVILIIALILIGIGSYNVYTAPRNPCVEDPEVPWGFRCYDEDVKRDILNSRD